MLTNIHYICHYIHYQKSKTKRLIAQYTRCVLFNLVKIMLFFQRIPINFSESINGSF